MDEMEIRARAAEIAMNFSAHVTGAMVNRDGLGNLSEMAPLAYVKEVENYIRVGKVPDPIPVIKREI